MAASGRRRVSERAVDEPAAEPGSVVDVVRAAAPVPALRRQASAAQPSVAAALRRVALTAGARDGVDQPRSHHRVDERGLLRSCGTVGRGTGETRVRFNKSRPEWNQVEITQR